MLIQRLVKWGTKGPDAINEVVAHFKVVQVVHVEAKLRRAIFWNAFGCIDGDNGSDQTVVFLGTHGQIYVCRNVAFQHSVEGCDWATHIITTSCFSMSRPPGVANIEEC
eukprot:12413269-Karenia_brevis.AAC.1